MRGGLGRRMVIRIPESEAGAGSPTTIAVQAGRFRYPPAGLFAGKAGSKAGFLRNGQDADPSGLTLCAPGGRDIVLTVPVAGGYGDPLERDPRSR